MPGWVPGDAATGALWYHVRIRAPLAGRLDVGERRTLSMLTTVVLIAVVVVGAATVVSILMQTGNVAGLIGGASGLGQQMFGKKRGLDDLLERVTMILGGILVVLIVVADKLWR